MNPFRLKEDNQGLKNCVHAHVSVSTMYAKALECMQKNKLENFEVPLKPKIIETFITEMSYYCFIETFCSPSRVLWRHNQEVCLSTFLPCMYLHIEPN